jgi:dihydropyrimidinase
MLEPPERAMFPFGFHFGALAATNAAKLYGLYPRKGTIAVGSDADIAIWDPAKEVRFAADALHDNVGYTPYEGRVITGWPTTVIRGCRVVVQDGTLCVVRGSGTFLPCARPDKALPLQRIQPELDD